MRRDRQMAPGGHIPVELRVDLQSGSLEVEIDHAEVPPDELFGFAQRRNSKRGFLFVSRVLGRHVPVAPSAMRRTYESLARLCSLPAGPVLVVGMAETAVGLGAGVHRELARLHPGRTIAFLSTTRHRLPFPLLATFEEEHSHATTHLLHEPPDPDVASAVRAARSLVVVDDEMSTGKTAANLVSALRQAGLRADDVTLVTLTDWSDGAAALAIGGDCRSASLLHGRYRWTAHPDPPPIEVPRVDVTGAGTARIDPSADWGRLGVLDHRDTLSPSMACGTGERILVLGTGEHVWRPFLLAEELERRGADVRFSSVTRSPIAMGHAIGSAFSFSDNYGLGIANFAYNVDRDAYDRIILCVETPKETVDPRLVEALRPEVLSDADGVTA